MWHDAWVIYNPPIADDSPERGAMDRESVNIQNDFFNRARKDRSRVTLFLVNGKKLVGRIKAFDRFTVLLEGGSGEQIVFKHAIAGVAAARSFDNRVDPRGRGGQGSEGERGGKGRSRESFGESIERRQASRS